MWPDSNALWVNTLYDVNSNGSYATYWLRSAENYCLGNKDTLLAGKTYRQIAFCDSTYKGALRDSAGRVYFWPKDSAQEYLLYDFAAAVGDTLPAVYMEAWIGSMPELHQVVVQQVDTVVYGGRPLRQLVVGNSTWFYGRWLEGIGCTQGLFRNPFPNISMLAVRLECFSMGDTSYYPDRANSACSKMYLSRDDVMLSPAVSVYPNPAHSTVNLHLTPEKRFKKLHITTISGEVVYRRPLAGEIKLQLQLGEMPAGTYLLRLEGKEGMEYIRLLLY